MSRRLGAMSRLTTNLPGIRSLSVVGRWLRTSRFAGGFDYAVQLFIVVLIWMGAVDRESDVAAELPVRTSGVAVAYADVRAGTADASGGASARTARVLTAAQTRTLLFNFFDEMNRVLPLKE